MTAKKIIQVQNLTKSFGDVKAVQGIDLEVSEGECLALLGPNGAGKTTTVEILEGLNTADAGEVRLFSKTLREARQEILQRVGVVLQETHLYKKLTVKETLELFASFFKKALPVAEILERVKLEEKADARLEHLSGGQKQRLFLGCGLINDPDLVFLDEPTTGLDPQARRMIWQLLKEFKQRPGRSIFLTTHYMDEAEQLADRVCIMDHGKIIAQGSPKQLIREICGEQTLNVEFARNGASEDSIKNNLSAKLPWFRSATRKEEGFEVLTTDAAKHIAELTEMTPSLNLKITSLRMRECTLEDVFIKLTGRTIRDAN